ncbi:MAG TPA: DUF3606 domain-containing protein [Pyrinomonadaceae bacterium]|nr:DUF3606 domain-containing protein [Pyrinomonadaceae bacterium]
MTDDRRKRGAPDRRRINLGQPYERAWWQSAFGVSKAQLAKAVAAVGVEVKAVREYFYPKPKPRKRAVKKAAKK